MEKCELYPRCTFVECYCYDRHILSTHLQDNQTSKKSNKDDNNNIKELKKILKLK